MTDEELNEWVFGSADMFSWNTHKHRLLSSCSSCTTAVWEASITKKRGHRIITWINSQSFCASPPYCFSCWPSCCQTCRKGSSSCPAKTQKGKNRGRPRGLNGWARMLHAHKALSARKQLQRVYKHTCTEHRPLYVSSMCAIWNNVARTFTFFHVTICDLVQQQS